MSMLSKQCKELRAEAERIGYWSPTASRLMFDAADILWSLRNKNVALLGENESLQAENDKLREKLAKARDPQRIGGQADPSSFVYAIEQLREFRWQHATNDEDVIPYINNVAAAHERENAKLRELVRHMRRCMSNEYTEIGLDFIATYCEYCEYDNDCGQCDFEQRMAELGIEVES